jgi:hypothetical protein
MPFQKTFTSTSATELDQQVREFRDKNPDLSVDGISLSTHQLMDIFKGGPTPNTQYTITYAFNKKS